MTIIVNPSGSPTTSGSVLQIIQQATGELGLAIPSYVAGNAAQDTVQQLALLNALGYELQRQHEWQGLLNEYRFTTQYVTTTGTLTSGSAVITGIPTTTGLDTTYSVTGTGIPQDTYILTNDSGTQVTLTQAVTASGSKTINFCKTKYTMPSDFDRPVNRTEWDKSKHWEMLGPDSPQQWQWLKSGYIATGPRLRFRPMGGYFQIWPPVTTAEYIGMEYVSQYWARDYTVASKASFTADSDTCVFPTRLMVLGLKKKYRDAKGLDSTIVTAEYNQELGISKGTDAGASTLSFAPRLSQQLIGIQNLPDSGFGG